MNKRISNPMPRNAVYLVTIILALVILVFGYEWYQERHETSSLRINVGGKIIEIETR